MDPRQTALFCHCVYVQAQEYGLYYLQSRYYDPEIGRFLNADVFVTTGQGLLGNDMFAYCNNNSVNCIDPHGTCFHRWDFWNDCEECAGKNFIRKIEAALSDIPGTFSVGVTGSYSLGFWSFGGQFGVSADLKGNVEYQWSFYGGLTTGTPGGTVELYGTVTNAPDVTKLRGLGYNIGVGIAAGAALTVDGVFLPDNELETTYVGASVAGGVGGGADFHVIWGETQPAGNLRYNVFDILEDIFCGK